ncbi:hypothetical protein COLO4_34252 [Corchorus olitorius]|uniref:Uncharacterized protein n=1 Tax=Corchorus olitorius TaxID=93759 RepID=A0A1R3GMH6_9ROSI|nr:hypothetical protein COLO4_34252 [Corchorus olitorius]
MRARREEKAEGKENRCGIDDSPEYGGSDDLGASWEGHGRAGVRAAALVGRKKARVSG